MWFVSLTLASLSYACEAPLPTPVGSVPADGQTGVPRDARVVVELQGYATELGWDVFVEGADGLVPGAITTWAWDDGSPSSRRWYVAIKPDLPLVANGAYTIRAVSSITGESWTSAFSAGTGAVAEQPTSPTLRLLDIGDVGAGATDCDYATVQAFTFEIEPGEDDAQQLSFLHLARVEPEGAEAPDIDHTWKLPLDGAAFEAEIVMDGADARSTCFAAQREDGAGRRTAWSAPVCTAEAGEDTGGGGPIDTGTRAGLVAGGAGWSCDVGAGVAGGLLSWLGAAVVWSRRRRHGDR